MKKAEVLKFMNKVKVYYPTFSLEDYVKEEWCNRLQPYDAEDLDEKFEQHLKGEYALEQPKLHYLTRYLKTQEQKEKIENDYLINCDLCGQEMYLSTYESSHRDKCLLIKALLPILKKHGEDVTYQILDDYDYATLDKVWDKYYPEQEKDLKEVLKNGRSNSSFD